MKAVILAAGESSRFKPVSDKRHKGLTRVLGKSLIEHTIEELKDSGVQEIIVVQGPEKEMEKQLEDKIDHFVVQEEPKGMGNALNQARELLNDKFLVLTPYRARASQFFEPMIEKAKNEGSEIVFVSTPTNSPEKYGILDIEDGKAVDIVEKPRSEEAPSNKKVVGMYLLSESFFDYLNEVEVWEYQYEDALSLQTEDQPASVLEIEKETNSVKYPWDLFSVTRELLDNIDRSISQDAEIADSAKIEGNVIVERGAKIFENAVIRGPSYVGKDAVVGNNALVREYSILEEGSRIGANSELRNTIMQPYSSIHSGYLGDSIIGRETQIGAETVAANRAFRDNKGDRSTIESKLIDKNYSKDTGRTRLGAIIGENVDVGVNVSIMPGIQIGSDSRIGPGTLVNSNVENGETVYASQDKVRKKD